MDLTQWRISWIESKYANEAEKYDTEIEHGGVTTDRLRGISVGIMNDPERPGPDADASEIAEWMESDFGRAVAEGMENASDATDREVVETEILNHQRGQVVGTIDTDGNLETESETLRELSQQYLDEGVPVLVPTSYENEDGEVVHGDTEAIVEPGTTGFVRAFIDEVPSPFDCHRDVLHELPVFEQE
jgi:hypothetical protein